ncbi:MAG TPA: methionyl-tRNA formyltransferase [Steroidobacteraceae bacterium]|jgi:methionyl-tRNA formyltransferase|nr:methionyl-tRNA formyltransferase [Steroidobacteraceae bacterium]
MRIAIVGQRDFGKAAMDAFVKRGDTIAGVFCAPEKPGEAPDLLRLGAEQAGIPVYALPSLRVEEARRALQALDVDLAVLAYVLQFVPQDFATIPRHGTIQFHPSLLPRYRGPSSINWPIILGDTRTGLTIFRPVDGLDEGPIILQKETAIGADETVGKVYFGRLFPMGIEALMEAAELVVSGNAHAVAQDESAASYEGWCRDPEARINWHSHVDQTYNLIRGCDPAPGAWTLFNQKKLQLYDVRKHAARTFSQVKGRIGAVTAIDQESLRVSAQGGQIEVFKLRYHGGKKVSAPQFCAEAGLALGTILGA